MTSDIPVPTEADYLDAARAYLSADGRNLSGHTVGELQPIYARHADFRAAVDSAYAAGIRKGRSIAAGAIVQHSAAHFCPCHADPLNEAARRTARRHLAIAARVADNPVTLQDAADALARGEAVYCHLDEAGRSVPDA